MATPDTTEAERVRQFKLFDAARKQLFADVATAKRTQQIEWCAALFNNNVLARYLGYWVNNAKDSRISPLYTVTNPSAQSFAWQPNLEAIEAAAKNFAVGLFADRLFRYWGGRLVHADVAIGKGSANGNAAVKVLDDIQLAQQIKYVGTPNKPAGKLAELLTAFDAKTNLWPLWANEAARVIQNLGGVARFRQPRTVASGTVVAALADRLAGIKRTQDASAAGYPGAKERPQPTATTTTGVTQPQLQPTAETNWYLYAGIGLAVVAVVVLAT